MMQNPFWIPTVLVRGCRHGYGIMRGAAKLSGGSVALKTTTLYTAPDCLETKGLILKGGEEIVDGWARRYYCLSDRRADALDDEAKALEMRALIAKAHLISMRSLSAGACPGVPCVTP